MDCWTLRPQLANTRVSFTSVAGDGVAAITELRIGDVVHLTSLEATVGTPRPRPRGTATALQGPTLEVLIARGLVRVTRNGEVLPTLEGAVLDAFLASDPRETAHASSQQNPSDVPTSQETFARVLRNPNRPGFDASTSSAPFGLDSLPDAGPLTVEEAAGLIAHLQTTVAAAARGSADPTMGPGLPAYAVVPYLVGRREGIPHDELDEHVRRWYTLAAGSTRYRTHANDAIARDRELMAVMGLAAALAEGADEDALASTSRKPSMLPARSVATAPGS